MNGIYRLAFVLVLVSPSQLACAESTNTWYLRGPDGGNVAGVVIDPASGKLLAGGNSGVFRYPATPTPPALPPDAWEFATGGLPPASGVVEMVATPAPVVYLNSFNGLAATTDGGGTWTSAAGGLPAGLGVSSITASAAAPLRVYAAINGIGVYRSDALGNGWLPTVTQPARLDLTLVRTSPTNANLLFAASDVDANGVANLYRSVDGGGSWTQVLASPGDANAPQQIFDVAQDPADANRLLAVTAFSGFNQGGGSVFVSTNAGADWSALSTNGLTINGDCCGAPRGLLFDRVANGTVYVGSTWGVFKSIDAGANWVFASNGLILMGPRGSGAQPADEVDHLAQRADGTLYAGSASGGVYFSGDAATSWTSHADGYASLLVRSMAFQPGGTGVVLAGAADGRIDGTYRSTDGGTSWARSAAGMYPGSIRGMAFSASNPLEVFAAGAPQTSIGGQFNKGLWKSTDAGINWTPIVSSALNQGRKRTIVIDPNDPNRILMSSASSVSLSTDGGSTWADSNTGLPVLVDGNQINVLGLAVGPGPVAGNRFYASMQDAADPVIDPPPPPGAQGGVYFSDDGGASWTLSAGVPNLPDDAPFYLAVSPTPGTLYVTKVPSSNRAGGVFKSTDYGVTWTNKSAGLLSLATINVAIDATDPNVLYAVSLWQGLAQPGGVFRSNNGGDSWVPYNIGIRDPDLYSVAIDPADHNHILVGGQEGVDEMHFAPDADQDGIPDSVEQAAAGGTGDGNLDGIPDYTQANVASTALGTTVTPAAATGIRPATTVAAYAVVEIDKTQPYDGICAFVSDLQVVPVDQIPLSDRTQQAAPTLRFQLPQCNFATVKIRYSNIASYAVPVYASYGPTVAGDGTSVAWGLLAPDQASVDNNGLWTLHLDQNAYGNVYAPGTGSILFQGAPGNDRVFANGFD